MKKVLKADKIKIVAVPESEAPYVDKKDFEALVALATAGAEIEVKHADVLAGTNAATFKRYQLEAGQTQVDIDLTGAKQFVLIEAASVLVFGDKRDVHEAHGAQPDHQLHGFIDKDRNWDR